MNAPALRTIPTHWMPRLPHSVRCLPPPSRGRRVRRPWPRVLPSAAIWFQTRRRILMRLVTLSAAAVLVAVAGAIFIAGPTSIALADVVKAAEGHKLVKYSRAQHIETKDGSSPQPQVVVAYADLRAPRFRTDVHGLTLNEAVDFQSVFVHDGTKGVTMHRITEFITEKGKTDANLVKMLKEFERFGTPRKLVTLTALQGDLTPATANKTGSLLENLRELEKHEDAVATQDQAPGY